MQILFLSQLLPYPLDTGPKVRAYYVLRYLAQHHSVTLAAFTRPGDKLESIAHLRQFCDTIYTIQMPRGRIRDVRMLAASILTGKPFVIQRDHVAEMVELLKSLLRKNNFVAVHADQLWMAQYATYVKSVSPKIKVVLDEHNAYFQIYKRLARGEANLIKKIILEREWRILQKYEAKVLTQCNQIVTVTAVDKNILLDLVNRSGIDRAFRPNFSMIPICVDPQSAQAVNWQNGTMNVLHMGTMFWLPNVDGVLWFAREVWPQIVREIPQATFTIIGKNPSKSIRGLARDPLIQVTGYVENPLPYLEKAAVFIVPLFSGSGMRVKILDAWAAGLPIVSTSIGAEGIQYLSGENILIADTPDAFADAVIKLLREPELAAMLRKNGRSWLETRYNWRTEYPHWDRVYE